MVSCKKIKREVSRAKMQEGIEKCKQNIADYLKDAQIIADEGRLCHSLISLEFALEELGKALYLQDLMAIDKSVLIKINGFEFCDHDFKVKKALEKIDPHHKYRVLFESMWERGVWEVGIWEGETVIGNETRLACCFVDYISGAWTLGKEINKDYLKDMVNLIDDEIKKL